MDMGGKLNVGGSIGSDYVHKTFKMVDFEI